MRKIFSLMLMATALLISGQVKAETKVAELTIGGGTPEDVTNLWDALQKISENANTTATIKLVAGAELAPGYVGEEKDALSGQKDRVSLNNGENITIDLNGNTMQQSLRFNLVHASITLTGKGTINATIAQPYNTYGSANANEDYGYCALTVGKDVTLNANGGVCAIAIFPNDYLLQVNTGTPYEKKHGPAGGTTIDIYGKIYSTTTCISSNGYLDCKEGNIPVVTVHKDAVLSANANEGGEAGIYGPGYAKYIIKGEVSGATGIYAKAGQWELNDAIVIATGNYEVPTAFGNGFNGNGDAVVFDSHGDYAGGIQVTISGDTKIESDNGHALQEVVTEGAETTQFIEIASGTFSGDLGAIEVSNLGQDNNVVEVQGGTFTSDVTNFIDQTKGGFVIESVDESGNEVFVISNTGSENPVSWTSDLLNATADSYVKLNSAVATEVNVNKDITCAFLAVEGWDKVIVKKGYTLTVGEVVLGETGVIEVESGAKLLVTGDKGLYSPAPENLILKADADGMATFIFKPTVGSNKSPKATVEYLTDARQKSTTSHTWNRFASVFDKLSDYYTTNKAELVPYFNEQTWSTFFEYWDATADKWTSCVYEDGIPQLSAFVGYSLTNRSINGGAKYAFAGQLHGSKEATMKIKKGWNYFGNSFTAPMSMQSFIDQLVAANVNIGGVYFWNNEKKYYDTFNFYSISEDGLGAYETIPAMQTFIFYSNSDEEVDVTIDYNASVWNINK